MAIICTVLHICNTAPLPLKPALLLVYNITWIQKLFICDVLHSRYIEKEEKSKFKKKKRKEEKPSNCNRCESEVWQERVCRHMHGAQPAVWAIYCAVFTKVFFCFPCPIFLKPFFIHCTPHWLPLLSSVLARFKKKFCFCFNFIFLISEGCCEHGRGVGGADPFFSFWTDVPSKTCRLN